MSLVTANLGSDLTQDGVLHAGDEPIKAPLEVEDLRVEHGGALNAGDRDIVIHDDVEGVASIRTSGSVRIAGSVRGQGRRECRIVAGGDVVVDGEVSRADVQGSHLRIGGGVREALLSTSGQLRLGGGAQRTRIQSTFFDDSKRRLDQLRQQIQQAVDLRDSIGRQIQQQRKRLDRFSRSLRTHVDLRVGNIVRPSESGLQIDLDPVYEALGDDVAEAAVDAAVSRLFIKGVVGTLTKRNRSYLSQNPAREQTFAQVLAQLRLFFESVRSRDKTLKALRAAEMERDDLIDSLVAPRDGLRVITEGPLRTGCEIRLQLTQVRALRDGNAQLQREAVTVRIAGGASAGRTVVELQPMVQIPEADAAVIDVRGRELVVEDVEDIEDIEESGDR